MTKRFGWARVVAAAVMLSVSLAVVPAHADGGESFEPMPPGWCDFFPTWPGC
ncbi:MAG: hypothetical protein QM713_13485 [Arachnia sp.]